MDRRFYLPFSVFSGIGPHKFNALIKTFGSAKLAFEASQSDLKDVIGEKTAHKFDEFRNKFDLSKFELELKKKKIEYICVTDKNYPILLKQIPNPPILLFVKGKIDFNIPAIGIVGTRKITSYGQEVTEKFSGELSENFVVVSGMALGVDGVAHKACLENQGKTIAVLGNGVDLPFPSSNKYLYDKIISGGGAVISEFPPGEPPSKGTFPSRNRIIAGISMGVLVTQGAEDSGSMITARCAMDFGRPVFAVPGPITSSLSKGPNSLISKGAKLIFDTSDILKELGIDKKKTRREKVKGENKEEQKVIDLLENESLSFDEIAKRIKLDASKTAAILSMMEIKGLIKTSEGLYLLV